MEVRVRIPLPQNLAVFNPADLFVHIPQLDLARLSQYFRACMVDYFFQRQLINERLARNTYNPYFHTNRKLFRATDVIASVAAAPA